VDLLGTVFIPNDAQEMAWKRQISHWANLAVLETKAQRHPVPATAIDREMQELI
jgi:hypothetical protein